MNYLLEESNIKYVVKNKYKLVDSEILIELLNILTENNIFNDEYLMINDALKQKDKRYLNESFNIDLFEFDDRESTFDQFYLYLNKQTRIKFKEKLKIFLENNDYIEFYFSALREKILIDNKTKEIYKNKIKEYLGLNNQNYSFKKNGIDFYIAQYYFLIEKGIMPKVDIDEKVL